VARQVSCLPDFEPEGEGDTLLKNIGSEMDYMALYPGRWKLSINLLLCLFLDLEDGGKMFLRNVG
jgi:hypothetical protein